MCHCSVLSCGCWATVSSYVCSRGDPQWVSCVQVPTLWNPQHWALLQSDLQRNSSSVRCIDLWINNAVTVCWSLFILPHCYLSSPSAKCYDAKPAVYKKSLNPFPVPCEKQVIQGESRQQDAPHLPARLWLHKFNHEEPLSTAMPNISITKGRDHLPGPSMNY